MDDDKQLCARIKASAAYWGLSLLLTSAAVELNQLTTLRSHRGSVETCCVHITIAIVNGMFDNTFL